MNFRIGFGYDVHRFSKDRKLILGGIEIPHTHGLKGHSDADVLLHAITDALLGAAALGDIGTHFPDTDPAYKNADSSKLLEMAYLKVQENNLSLINLDATVITEKPVLKPYIISIRERIAEILITEVSNISVKATTNEAMGFVGRSEGIAVHAVALLGGKNK